MLPLATILWHRRDFAHHLDNVRRAWTWSVDDFKWLALMGFAMLSPRIALPHQGKFNAAEKLNFMSLTVTYPIYVVTGITIWFFGPAFVSWLVHLSMAMLATPLIFGHVFMATVNPDTRVGLSRMITGIRGPALGPPSLPPLVRRALRPRDCRRASGGWSPRWTSPTPWCR